MKMLRPLEPAFRNVWATFSDVRELRHLCPGRRI